jgi:hypothetical protein
MSLSSFLCNLIDIVSSSFDRLFCIQVVTSVLLKDVFRAQEAPSTNSLCRPLYVLGLGACLYSDKLKWNEAYPHKLVAA